MLHPTVFNTAQICSQLGVRHAVMSPGSRNAPLTISFARHPEIAKWIVPDERSAAFIALGIAQETKTPVVICCTSGSALLNYAPAIAEAYYREIPLIVLSADRPPELIDQRDGQTIRQYEVLKNHVKQSFQLPIVVDKKEAKVYEKSLVEAIQESKRLPAGPVHINIPFKEPFYPSKDDKLLFNEVIVKEVIEDSEKILNDIPKVSEFRRPLILIGQQRKDGQLNELLTSISDKIPVIRSPLNNLQVGIQHADAFIKAQKILKPDLLITSGLSVLSKNLKVFLRKHQPIKHLHFDEGGVKVDTYQSNPELVKLSLSEWLKSFPFGNIDADFINSWKNKEQLVHESLGTFMQESTFSESKAAFTILNSIPLQSKLHLSNSMPVRYADLFGVKDKVECFANRGTSGIDGCTSTAIGTSLVSKELNVLFTGDLAFLYDRNAFFHNYSIPNLRVIVLNNHGGGIFRLIDGPSRLPELEEYFETRHNRTAEYICRESKLMYLTATDENELNQQLEDFFEDSGTAKVLEVFTNPETNQRVYKELKNYINERIGN